MDDAVTQELRDPDTGISVVVWNDEQACCAMYRFSTDTEAKKVPEHFTEQYWGGHRTTGLKGLACSLLHHFAELRPYEVSKFSLMQ